MERRPSLDWSTATRTYRQAFENFRERVRAVQTLYGGHSSREKIDTAILELEKARQDYRAARNALLREMIPSDHTPPQSPDSAWNQECIREIAQLLWELEGRPEGAALDNWHRAEEIARRAVVTHV
jgi:hypothetical protein